MSALGSGMQLEEFIEETYGLSGDLTKLEGELDENYLVEGDFGKAIFKLMRTNCDASFIEMQVKAHQHLEEKSAALDVPRIILSRSGKSLTKVPTEEGDRLAWMISFVDGCLMATARPWSLELCKSMGQSLARLDKGLADFEHPRLSRPLRWDLLQAGWIKNSKHLLAEDERSILDPIIDRYDANFERLKALPHAVIHNDANEMNVFVDSAPTPSAMTGIIDFGDMIRTARISEAVIAAAYVMMDADDALGNAAALLAGYHGITPLNEAEIDLFFPLIEMRLAVSVTNSAERKAKEPDDPYLVLHEAPAWRLLRQFQNTDRQLLTAYFQKACSKPASQRCKMVSSWLEKNNGKFAAVFPKVELNKLLKLDLSFGSAVAVNLPEAKDTKALNRRIDREIQSHTTLGAIGGWGEARPIYNGSAFGRTSGNPLAAARTHHLGVDITLPAGTAVHTPMDGTVFALGFAEDQFDYGGYLILEHRLPTGEAFYSLFGHLDASSMKHLAVREPVKAGDKIAELGTYEENGGWWPHLHLQLMTETPATTSTPPGACERQFWHTAKELYPNPAHILNLPESATDWYAPNKSEQLERRKSKTASNQKLSYRDPLQVSRGWKHFLCDHEGRTFIDAYNNVPHVGHANPAVIEAVTQQMELVSTNTRYVHESLMAFAEQLTSKAPAGLTKCFFTSSASEANELAIRIARKVTGNRDMLVMEHGYHGITTGAMAISPYKFNQKGGEPQQGWVHVTPQPDPYRGRYAQADNVSADCIRDTRAVIDKMQLNGRRIAGFISECLPSVGGQLVMPEGALKGIYSAVRGAGGLCIADDVQTSLGRLGDYFWGFEYQNVVPDMIVLGKPLGNGHPLAALITTQEIADSFADGPEFFTTFGGSTVSCTAGLAVLEQIEQQGLQNNAKQMGAYLRSGFEQLKAKHPIIGDVRGMGLFWGLDLVKNTETREPATDIADYVKNRLYEKNILIGTDGPFDNVLKIRPPMTFDQASADILLQQLALIFAEKPARI